MDNYKIFEQYMNTLLSKTAREIFFDMQETYYQVFAGLNEQPILHNLLYDSLVERNEDFYKTPFEIINNEVNFYNLKEKKINYLFTQKLHSANKLKDLEDSSKIKINNPNFLINTDSIRELLVAILKDYKNGYCPKLSKYKKEVDKFILECIEEIRKIEDIKKDKELTAYFSSAENLAGHCKAKIFINVFALIMEIEIENHCTKLLNELQVNTETHTDKAEPEPFEDTENSDVTPKKLKWTGTAAQFGYIMQELIGKGYIEKPTGSYAKDAEFYLQHFEIEGKKSTLIKELSETQNSFSNTNRALLKITPKEKLK